MSYLNINTYTEHQQASATGGILKPVEAKHGKFYTKPAPPIPPAEQEACSSPLFPTREGNLVWNMFPAVMAVTSKQKIVQEERGTEWKR